MNPTISVIIPTFNRCATLTRCLDGIFSQSFKDYEVIVVDDGSDDDTKKICEQYELHYIYQENSGVSVARNNAVKIARGRWLAFCDSDDEWLPNKLQQQYDFVEDCSLKLVHTNEIWIRDDVRVNPHLKHTKGGGDQFFPSLQMCMISPSTVMIQKEVFMELGGFREDFPVCEDYDLWLKFCSLYEVGYIDSFCIKKYGGHPDQLSRKYIGMDYYRCLSLMWILNNRELSADRYEAVMSTLQRKLSILLKGAKKHKNQQLLQKLNALVEFVGH